MEDGESEMTEQDSEALEFELGSGSKISAKQQSKKSKIAESDE